MRYLQLQAARRRLLARIAPADRGGRLPLSLQQQRLWLVETVAGGETGAYHIPTLLRLRGRLDVHEVFRRRSTSWSGATRSCGRSSAKRAADRFSASCRQHRST